MFEDAKPVEETEKIDNEEQEELLDDAGGENEPAEPTEEPEELEDDELSIMLDGQQIPDDEDSESIEGKPAPAWVKELRRVNREQAKEIKELKRTQSQSKAPAAQNDDKLPSKPTLEDFDYDSDAYEKAVFDYAEKKKAFDLKKQKQEELQNAENERWQKVVNSYQERKKSLKLKGIEEAEQIVQENLDEIKQAIILEAVDDPALVIYILGKNKKELDALKQESNPVKFAVKVAKLEARMKVEKKNGSKPAPEKRINADRVSTSAVDSALEKLREEAAKTGDYSKIMRYKAQMKNKK